MGRSFVGIAGFRVGVMTEHQVAEFVCDAQFSRNQLAVAGIAITGRPSTMKL